MWESWPLITASLRFGDKSLKQAQCLLQLIIAGITAFFFSACANSPNSAVSHGMTVFKGFNTPEDMVILPNTDYLVVSEGAKGAISLFDTRSHQVTIIYAVNNTALAPSGGLRGDKDCRQPPQVFYPHGIDLHTDGNGKMTLFVVNHGGREAIEIFELTIDQNIRLRWRGCVNLTRQRFSNNVAALADGGFVITANPPITPNDWDNPWQVLRWHPQRGLLSVAAFERGSGNGINVSRDGQFIYVNDVNKGRVIKIALQTGKRVGEVAINSADNNSWMQDGRLLVASVPWDSWQQITRCLELTQGHCDLAFEVYAVDPQTMAKELLYSHDGSDPFGGASVAVEKEGYLYFGSFAGDRIARWKLP